jgi:hypothetical protein
MRWTIYIGDYAQHSVSAGSEDEAIARWLDEQGYESTDHAAQEYEGMTGEDVFAVCGDFDEEFFEEF